jgi:hypothetical protein
MPVRAIPEPDLELDADRCNCRDEAVERDRLADEPEHRSSLAPKRAASSATRPIATNLKISRPDDREIGRPTDDGRREAAS